MVGTVSFFVKFPVRGLSALFLSELASAFHL